MLMQSSQKVSVIISYYNAMKYIDRCVTCITGQTYENLEIILVDDGSSDGCGDRCRELTAGDDRVVHIRKPNTGVSDSRNRGLRAATGDWLYFADVDDLLVPDAIETLFTAAYKGGCSMAIAEFYRVRGDRYFCSNRGYGGVVSKNDFLKRMLMRPANIYYGSLWNKIFKREVFEESGAKFDGKIAFGEDHLFFLQMLDYVDKIAVVDRPLYYYMDNDGSLMHQGVVNPVALVKNKLLLYKGYNKLYKDAGMDDKVSDKLKSLFVLVAPATDAMVMPYHTQIDGEQASIIENQLTVEGLNSAKNQLED